MIDTTKGGPQSLPYYTGHLIAEFLFKIIKTFNIFRKHIIIGKKNLNFSFWKAYQFYLRK